MKKISSSKKGLDFEDNVFQIIRELLDNDEFYVNNKRSYIYRRKNYYSEARKDNITVDISIETFLEKADKYSTLTVIECKNYNDKGVPVNDIEEFESKLNQIGEHNTKGILITNSFFQKSTISIALSKKIGLIRINVEGEIDWINYRKGDIKITALESIYKELSTISPYVSFTSTINKKCFKTLSYFLIEFGIIDQYKNKPKYIRLPYLSEKEIDEIIAGNNLFSFHLKDKLNIDNICKFLNEVYEVNFVSECDLGLLGTNKILGKISFNPIQIHVDRCLLADKYRLRFTIAHEIGHFILHYDTLKKFLDENIDNDMTLNITHDDIVTQYNKRLEIQANIFASRLLIPQDKLIKQVASYFVEERIHKGFLYLDHQPVNIKLLRGLLIKLQDQFFVSKEVAQIRLVNEGLLREKRGFNLFSSRR